LHIKLKSAFQNIVGFAVNSNLWIAFGAWCWVQQTRLLLSENEKHLAVDAVVFFATLFIYNMHRLVVRPDRETETLTEMHHWMDKHLVLLKTIMAISAVVVLTAACFLHWKLLLLLGVVGAVSVFYTVPLPFTNHFRLRDIGILKPVFVAFVWACVGVVLPLVAHGVIARNAWLLAAHCFLFFTAITIPFDIRDMKFDRRDLKFPTLAEMAGLQVAKAVSLLVLLLSAAIFGWLFPQHAAATGLWYVITGWLIYNTRNDSSEYHYTFWLDGTIVAGYFILLINNCFA
jgi:hypothetical protein